MADVSKYQTRHNGPLRPEVIAVLDKIRLDRGWSYKTLGEHLGVSGPFAHAILNKPSNITTSTAMQKVAAGIERLENKDYSRPSAPAQEANDGLVDFTFGLRAGMTVRLALPADLTDREAERLSLFVRSLVQ